MISVGSQRVCRRYTISYTIGIRLIGRGAPSAAPCLWSRSIRKWRKGEPADRKQKRLAIPVEASRSHASLAHLDIEWRSRLAELREVGADDTLLHVSQQEQAWPRARRASEHVCERGALLRG